eukprot:CAMPEP_0206487302 /NCGR_PEP_ID=MMETSP0324_2-20121206/41546_1 /ASSEMBLY_ACC=CAM_ASM_000836 /TAXON_ID=2866 /ORGANISM="Crypthecodinium cohnii, Strain Seligo" /LENGTH=93 /DNA_ID=CAMNT_0053965729 /DNA_START=746 /DNA_END=1027 /DNA_ORIENTATION=-
MSRDAADKPQAHGVKVKAVLLGPAPQRRMILSSKAAVIGVERRLWALFQVFVGVVTATVVAIDVAIAIAVAACPQETCENRLQSRPRRLTCVA